MIRKVVIPIAGRGTRLMPVTSVLPKALFPLVEAGQGVKAVLHVILDQVADAGIRHVALVVSPGQTEAVERYMGSLPASDQGDRAELTFIEQTIPRGFGDAVLRTRDFVADEPFAILLGDHIHIARPGSPSCLRQAVRAFDRAAPAAMIGVHEVGPHELPSVGVTRGERLAGEVYRCLDFVEKPSPATARKRLRTEGLSADVYLGHCGIYVFSPEIFQCLSEERRLREACGAEVELAGAQAMLLARHPAEYLLCKIDGRAYDMGTPAGYFKTCLALEAQGALNHDRTHRDNASKETGHGGTQAG